MSTGFQKCGTLLWTGAMYALTYTGAGALSAWRLGEATCTGGVKLWQELPDSYKNKITWSVVGSIISSPVWYWLFGKAGVQSDTNSRAHKNAQQNEQIIKQNEELKDYMRNLHSKFDQSIEQFREEHKQIKAGLQRLTKKVSDQGEQIGRLYNRYHALHDRYKKLEKDIELTQLQSLQAVTRGITRFESTSNTGDTYSSSWPCQHPYVPPLQPGLSARPYPVINHIINQHLFNCGSTGIHFSQKLPTNHNWSMGNQSNYTLVYNANSGWYHPIPSRCAPFFIKTVKKASLK